jgi:hypothetical protein
MGDIFDAKIVCRKCGIEMERTNFNKQGFELRAVKCGKCNDKIIHPSDLGAYKDFQDLRGKTFNVKLRMVGNSHAISIPKEIVNFMNEQHKTMEKQMDDMVRLCFDDFHRVSLSFGDMGDYSKSNGGIKNEERY